MVRVDDYFDVRYGSNLELASLELDPNGVNFVSRTEKNNGVSARVKRLDDIKPNPAKTISVAGGGNSVMESSLQEEEYYSGRDLFFLVPKIDLAKIELLYYCLCLKTNRFRFNYGRQANKTLKALLIPSKDEIPTWVERQKLPTSPKKTAISIKKQEMRISEWKKFRYDQIFVIERGSSEYLKNMGKGEIPYISASSQNNGVTAFVNKENFNGEYITLSYDGAVGEAYYQTGPFFASEKVAILALKEYTLNKYIAFFLITLIRKEQYRYNYGLKWSIESRMKKSIIKLPVDHQGNPDWEYMEAYIKSLPYSSNL